MEPEIHRLDREAMLADRLAVADRVRRETDEIVAAAVAKRRAYDEWQFQRLRSFAAAEKERRRVLTGRHEAAPLGVTDERLGAALQRSKVLRRRDSAAEPVLPEAAAS